MLRDINRQDLQVKSVAKVIIAAAPDILVLQGIDYDARLMGLNALRKFISKQGLDFPFLFAPIPNSGQQTGLDIDNDGRFLEPEDAQGYGDFYGQRGFAILSKFPIDHENLQDFSELLWVDYARATDQNTQLFETASVDIQRTLRLSSTSHVVVPIWVNKRKITIMAQHATPPVFDGPEDRNGQRNMHENLFFTFFLAGHFGKAPDAAYVFAGISNVDPNKGQGYKSVMKNILTKGQFQNPPAHREFPTVDWPDPTPGDLRVSYLLPSPDLSIVDAGIFRPETHPKLSKDIENASRHRLVWIDIDF